MSENEQDSTKNVEGTAYIYGGKVAVIVESINENINKVLTEKKFYNYSK